MNNNIYQSGVCYRLDSLAPNTVYKCVSGEADLFIARFSENNMLERKYLYTITSSRSDKDSISEVILMESVGLSEELYVPVMIPVGDVKFEPVLSSNEDVSLVRIKNLRSITEYIVKKYPNAEISSNEMDSLIFQKKIINVLFSTNLENPKDKVSDLDSKHAEISLQQKLNGLRKLVSAEKRTIVNAEESSTKSAEVIFARYSTDAEYVLSEISSEYGLELKEEYIHGICDSKTLIERVEQQDWRYRKITLPKDFYNRTFKPLLAFTKDKTPVLLKSKMGRVSYTDAVSGRIIKIDKSNADTIRSTAFCFYRVFPEKGGRLRDLIRFVFSGTSGIITMILALGLIGAFCGMLLPMFTSYIIDKLIPFGQIDHLVEVSLFLFFVVMAQTIINIVPSITMMIFSVEQLEKCMAGLFDRVLKLSPGFIKKYTTGDLTNRIMGGLSVQTAIFQIITSQFLSSLFALSGLIMMFYYSPILTIAGICITLIFSLIFFLLSTLNYVPLKKHAEEIGKLSGMTRQFISGIVKIRVVGAESRIINKFLESFVKTEKLEYIIARNGSIQRIFSSIYPIIVSVLFYVLIIYAMDRGSFSLGVFLAFMAAFQSFESGVIGLAGSVWNFLTIQPDFKRIKPLFEEKCEGNKDSPNAGKLNGNIEISNITLRYSADSSYVLNNVSLKAEAGEFIAIVGPSGAGKSSLVRVLLGFENPEKGAVYYDGKDLKNLNFRSVRSQIGTVLQQSRLMNASILDNVLVGTDCKIGDAEQALSEAAMDEDLANFPMGIHTILSDDNVSGGQKQRVLLARAIVNKPKIVIMDESTSALDNIAQKRIMQNLKNMNMTRIVVAHRLSTIKDADRIYVLNHGRIEEQGTFDELMQANGLFSSMAKDQML